MRVKLESGNKEEELLIFNYAPNLKVVGGFHALNDEDKITLETLIDAADFVALEADEVRINNSMTLKITSSSTKIGWDAQVQKYYVNPIDSVFLILFSRLLNKYYELGNTDGCFIKRDASTNEMTFAYDYAKQKNNDVYFVDLPIYEVMSRLCSMSIFRKIHQILYLFDSCRSVQKDRRRLVGPCSFVEKILTDDRRDYMLGQIEINEGPIIQLKRKGLFIVGRTHGENYLKSLQRGYR